MTCSFPRVQEGADPLEVLPDNSLGGRVSQKIGRMIGSDQLGTLEGVKLTSESAYGDPEL
jgi:hypothetical protein